MKKTIQEININISTLDILPIETLLTYRRELESIKAGSFMGAVRKQYYIHAVDDALKDRKKINAKDI